MGGFLTRAYNSAVEGTAMAIAAISNGAVPDADFFGIAAAASGFGQGVKAQNGGTRQQREDAGDAARHAYWQAVTAYHYGRDVAQQIADIHEQGQRDGGLDDQRASWIDEFNNEVARRAGEAAFQSDLTEEQLIDLLLQMLLDGSLIVDRNDPRIPLHLRDWDNDGIPDSEDCDLPPGVNPIMYPGSQTPIPKEDINKDGAIDMDDFIAITDAVGETNPSKDQNGDCQIWVDDLIAVLEAVEP